MYIIKIAFLSVCVVVCHCLIQIITFQVEEIIINNRKNKIQNYIGVSKMFIPNMIFSKVSYLYDQNSIVVCIHGLELS